MVRGTLVTVYLLSSLLSHKQNYIRGWGQQCIFYPKEKVQMTKKHIKDIQPHIIRKIQNETKYLVSAHNISQKEERFLLPNVDKDLRKAFSIKVHGIANWYSNLISLSNFKICHLRPRNSTCRYLSHRIPYTITQRCVYKNGH